MCVSVCVKGSISVGYEETPIRLKTFTFGVNQRRVIKVRISLRDGCSCLVIIGCWTPHSYILMHYYQQKKTKSIPKSVKGKREKISEGVNRQTSCQLSNGIKKLTGDSIIMRCVLKGLCYKHCLTTKLRLSNGSELRQGNIYREISRIKVYC